MKECTLIIMAAGLGSRFQGGVKQLEPIGPNGETIMDYSIYDAYQAGIHHVVLIIREEFEDVLTEHFQNKLPNDLKLEYIYQKLTDIPEPYVFPERTKPWGTGHAILSCKDVIKNSFMVINADDYYGKSAFEQIKNYLYNYGDFCMAGYILSNTLSEYGTVNRGICKVNTNNLLEEIEETYKISITDNIVVGQNQKGEIKQIDTNCFVSMNCFGFNPSLFEELEMAFEKFLRNIINVEKEEFLLPTIVQNMIQERKTTVTVLPTYDKWFGMTYQEDKIEVKEKIETFIEEGKYPSQLWK